MSHIVPFQFESHAVRTLTHADGSIWWVLADVCAAIGIRNPTQAASRLKDDEVSRPMLDIGQLNIVNEKGLYRLIMRSDKPECSRFQDWVFGEVLSRECL